MGGRKGEGVKEEEKVGRWEEGRERRRRRERGCSSIYLALSWRT